jgi:hypothetical protein
MGNRLGGRIALNRLERRIAQIAPTQEVAYRADLGPMLSIFVINFMRV